MKIFRNLIAIMVLSACVAEVNAQMFESVDDMALIWVGARHRPDWNKELFTPYLVHEFADGHKTWLFDGFLMIEGWTHDVRRPDEPMAEYLNRRYSFGEAPYNPANKEMWEWLLDRQLGLNDGLACRALDERIGELLPEMGAPSYKHQVVMTLPVSMGADMTWGKLDGKALNFANFEDKVAAMKWYVDLLLEKWEQAEFKNIELAGIYWLRESISDGYSEEACAKAMCDYAHEKGLKAYWIPYYRATHYSDWKKYGFDQVYHQPNYVFDLSVSSDHLDNAIKDAYDYDLGMLMEFEGTCIDGIDDGIEDTRKVVNQWNSCLYNEESHGYYDRMVEYVDKFEKEMVFNLMPVAYYNGYQAVYDFANSKNPKDREIIDRLASNIELRHRVSNWYAPKPAAGIDDVVDVRAVVYGVEGGIYVSSEVSGMVDIFTVEGRKVNSECIGEQQIYGYTIECPSGIYIVSMPGEIVKVAVK